MDGAVKKTLDRDQLPRHFAGFKDLHRGESMLVCGCGSSLVQLDRDPGLVTIGVNDVGRLFQPTYLVVLNPEQQFKDDRFRYVEQSKAKALFSQLNLAPRFVPLVRFQLGEREGTDFSNPEVLPYTRNSPYVALALAVHMGATRIGLLGVDFTDHHFFQQTGPHPLAGEFPKIDAQYRALGKALSKRKVQVFNLSATSRLTAFPKMDFDDFFQNGKTFGISSSFPHLPKTRKPFPPLTVGVEQSGAPIIGKLLDAFATTLGEMGHRVNRMPRRWREGGDSIVVTWNGRHIPPGKRTVIYCEHGWLPRWDYQLSTAGINADNHIAPFEWGGRKLTSTLADEVDAHLARIRQGGPTTHPYMQTEREALVDLPQAFLLVPLQIENDTNIIRHVPPMLRKMQHFIDYVSGFNPNLPLLFKQHPADARSKNCQLLLRLRRRQDVFFEHSRGNIHQILKSGRCKGIISLNSNVVHDGLLWNIPSVVLGNNIWPRSGQSPFMRAVPKDWRDMPRFFEASEPCRMAYCHFLMRNQWTVEDISNPDRVAAFLAQNPISRFPKSVARKTARKRLPRPPRPRPDAGGKTVNLVCRNLGWVFQDFKRHACRLHVPGVRIVGSERPLSNADAWIFPRTREAAKAPDMARSVVQIHDNWDDGAYGLKGNRALVRHCGALVFTHPYQKEVLKRNGISIRNRPHFCRPIGAGERFKLRSSMAEVFTVGWVGRPVNRNETDIHRAHWLPRIAAALTCPPDRIRFLLVGERLEFVSQAIRRSGRPCHFEATTKHGMDPYPGYFEQMDVLVMTSSDDPVCLSISQALAVGVPVIAADTGWVSQWIQPGLNGYLADRPEAMARRIEQLLKDRETWFGKRAAIRASQGGYSMEQWLRETVNLALGLL